MSEITTGSCGNDLQWLLIRDTDSSHYDLIIRGTGDMYDYDITQENYPPWYFDSITSLSLPAGLTSIGKMAFMGLEITSVTIPNSVTHIGEDAFSGTPLSSLTIPASVDTIDQNAFRNSTSLTSIKLSRIPTTIERGSFALGTLLNPVTCIVTSPDNIADGCLSGDMAQGGPSNQYTTFIYQASNIATYGYLTRNNTKIQVESAIRDGLGRRIDTHYPIKKEEEWTHRLYSDHLTLVHNLGEPPSSVMIFVVDPDAGSYTQIYGDVEATSRDISITFTTLPSYGSKLLIKALI